MAPKRIKVSPGKTQSQFGFIVGIVFVFIGIFVAIPAAGLFGIFWTACAALICFSHYRNGFSNQRIPTYEIDIDEGEATYQESTSSIESRLKQLEDLYNRGLITRDEYDQKRKEILDEL